MNLNRAQWLGIWLTAVSVLAMTLAPAASAEPQTGQTVSVALSTEPDGPTGIPPGKLSIAIPANATGTTIPVFLKNLLPSAASDLRIFATSTRDADGVPISESAITIAFPTAEGGVVNLGPNDEISGTLSLEGLTTPGTFSASVWLDHDETDQQLLASVEIVKRSVLDVALEGAGEAGLVVTERSPVFERTLALISGSSQEATVDVTLGQIIGPDGQPTAAEILAECKSGLTGLKLEALGRVPLLFRIATPLSGDYVGSLQIRRAPEQETVQIKITRSRPAPSIEMDGPLTTPVEFVMEGDTTLTVRVSETEGRTVAIAPPSLFVSRDVAGSPGGTGVTLGTVTTDPPAAKTASKPVTPEPCPGAIEGFSVERASTPPAAGESVDPTTSERIVVPPGDAVTVSAQVQGFREPGRYTATLRFNVEDSTALKADVTIVARRSALVAGGMIFAGILFGLVVRWLVGLFLPRQKLRSRLARAAEKATKRSHKHLTPDERPILAEIRDRIRETAETLRSWDWESAKDQVTALVSQVDRFDDYIAILAAFAQVPAGFATRVNEVKIAMRARTLSEGDETALLGMPKLLEELRSAIRELPPKPEMAGAPSPRPAPDLLPRAEIDRRIQLGSIAILILLIVGGTALGVQVLWASNDVWGTIPDFGAALLWGGGIWAASGQAFGGTEVLLKTILGQA